MVAFVVAAIGFAAFFVIELRVSEPIVPLRFFADRTIAAGIALSAIIGIGLFSVTAYLPTYFQMAYRTSATVSGLVPIATVFGMLVSNLAHRMARQPHRPLPGLPDRRHVARARRGCSRWRCCRSARRCGCRWS